jgi:hypothetical protein
VSYHARWLRRAAAGVTAASLAGLSIASTASAASASQASSPRQSPRPVAVKMVNLHARYLKALPHARAGHIEDALRPRGWKPAHGATGPKSCTEPACPLIYNGGTVQHTPHVYLVLWGPVWSGGNPDVAYLNGILSGLGVTPQDTWSATTSQYTDGTGHPAFGPSVLQGIWQDSSTPPSGTTQAQLTAEADAFVAAVGVGGDLNDAQVVIATQTGTFPAGFGTAYCAWHSNSLSSGVPFTNLPYQPDVGGACGANIIDGTYDGFSIVEGHEYAETITDPYPVSGWWDSADPAGGEIGDKCAWTGIANDTFSTGTFPMQTLWSNSANACVQSTVTTPPPAVTGVSPNSGPAAGGTHVTITGTALAGGSVAFGANPATGVSCGATSCTATSPAGSGTVDVRVTTMVGTSPVVAADQFTYTSPSTGPIRSGISGKCADDWHSGTGNGNKIDIFSCNGSGAQNWTVESNGSLRNASNGKCLDVTHSGTANGTLVQLYTCNGTGAQVWTANMGALVNPRSGKCLEDPAYGGNGTQLDIRTCTGGANQRWTLP